MKSMLLVFGMLALTLGTMAYMNLKSKDPILEEIQARVVKIEAYDDSGQGGQGTGALIGDNKILTAAHLFPEKPKGHIHIGFRRLLDEENTEAVVVSSNTLVDLAILQFNGVDQTIPIRITPHWRLGEPLIILGNPRRGDFILGHTQINAYTIARAQGGMIRDTLMFDCNEGGPGFSGSGVYNSQGELVGIFELGEAPIDLLQRLLIKFSGAGMDKQQCFAIPGSEILRRMK